MVLIPIHYKEYREEHAPLIVFIHGGGVSGWMWDKQIDYFTDFHCLVPDLSEHGSSKHSDHFSIQNSAEQILALIEEKGKGKTVIAIGFSLGAQILIAMLSRKPELIHYAIINSALVKPMPYARLLIKTITLAYPLTKNKTFSKIQAASMYIREDHFETYYQESCKVSKDTLLRVLAENMSFTIPQGFERANSRILVTVGEKEKSIMKDSMTELVKRNSNCKGVVITGIGHGVSLANPELFHNLIESWIGNKAMPHGVIECN